MTPALSAPQVEIDARVSDPRWEEAIADLDALCGRALAAAAIELAASGEVSVLFTDDEEMRDLNARWRNIDKPTDVLSFPSDGPVIPGAPRLLGDIALGFETAMRDAEAMKRPPQAHISHLLVHGFLHLLGYDHIESKDAAVMEPLEARILADLGWPDPYATGPYGDPD